MEETKNTAALILNRQAYREEDSLVVVYSRHFGKLSLVARGTQKLKSKLAGHIEPLTLADIMIIRGKGYNYIGSAVTREIYADIRNNLNKLYYAGQALNLFNRLVQGEQADKNLFFLLTNWLEVLNNFGVESIGKSKILEFSKEKGELIFAFFVFKFLKELGYQPEVFKCLKCGHKITSGKNHFNLAAGGIICEICLVSERRNSDLVVTNLLAISDNVIKLVRFIIKEQFKRAENLKINHKTIKELMNLVNNILAYNF